MLTRFTKLTGARGNGADKALPMPAAPAAGVDQLQSEIDSANRIYTDVKVRLHQRLLDEINLPVIEKLPPEAFREQTGVLITRLLKEERVQLNQREQAQITNDVIDEMMGLGPLEPLLKDPTSTTFWSTPPPRLRRAHGHLELTPVRFKDDRHLLRSSTRSCARWAAGSTKSQPTVDARLADGAASTPSFRRSRSTARCSRSASSRASHTMEKLVDGGSVTAEIAELLRGIVEGRQNVLISGGTGTGKTTMLNALSRYIDERERIITIEDAAELQLQQIHVARWRRGRRTSKARARSAARPCQERAAHAARPHHRRRGPRRRSLRHAAGHEYRP